MRFSGRNDRNITLFIQTPPRCTFLVSLNWMKTNWSAIQTSGIPGTSGCEVLDFTQRITFLLTQHRCETKKQFTWKVRNEGMSCRSSSCQNPKWEGKTFIWQVNGEETSPETCYFYGTICEVAPSMFDWSWTFIAFLVKLGIMFISDLFDFYIFFHDIRCMTTCSACFNFCYVLRMEK